MTNVSFGGYSFVFVIWPHCSRGNRKCCTTVKGLDSIQTNHVFIVYSVYFNLLFKYAKNFVVSCISNLTHTANLKYMIQYTDNEVDCAHPKEYLATCVL